MTGQERAGQGSAVQSRVGKCEDNAKDNTGHSALQEKVKGITDSAQGGGQGRADYYWFQLRGDLFFGDIP